MKQKIITPEPIKAADAAAMKRLFTFRLGAVFGKQPADLPAGKRRLLDALRLYFAYRHNGFVLVEALELCTAHGVNPPAWVLKGLAEGFQRFNAGRVSLERALGLTKRHREEYAQYRAEHAIMGEIRNLIEKDPRRRIAIACRQVTVKHRANPVTLEKQYRRFWRGFFDYVAGETGAG
jgi:hypothetical protein